MMQVRATKSRIASHPGALMGRARLAGLRRAVTAAPFRGSVRAHIEDDQAHHAPQQLGARAEPCRRACLMW